MSRNTNRIIDNIQYATEIKCPKANKISNTLAKNLIKNAIDDIKNGRKGKINAIWLETSGCFGEVISLLNGENPDIIYLLSELVNMQYFGTIQGDQGEIAFDRILDTLDTEFIFIVCGALPRKDGGLYTRIATYNGKPITAINAVSMIAPKAKHIVAVGTCATFGGPTGARPNVSNAVSISEYLNRKDIINIPGCPANPIWTLGILAYIISYGIPTLDSLGRPKAYYGELIHDICERRQYFDKGDFAKKLGEKQCMFKLGCKGPITPAYCPISRWNNSNNWPIGDNTPCVGCAAPGFPDDMEPFITYEGGV